ncbi:MAG: FHA domain-containing protein [Ideonella sp.]|nr:FHA domain-containing protein [Ideonella sp.]
MHTTHPLQAATGHWADLQAALYSEWHALTHARAGRQRVAHAQLCLGQAWFGTPHPAAAPAPNHEPRLRTLAQFMADAGAKVEVLRVVSPHTAELRLRWVAWHAPPQASFIAQTLPPPGPTPDTTPHSSPTPTGDSLMKFPFFSKTEPSPAPHAGPAQAQEPSLTPQPLGATRAPGAQLTQALSQLADHIARQEVQDLIELGMHSRYRLHSLNFWVSAANQPALRKLMDINQREPAAAKRLVEAAFAKSGQAALLDISRLSLVFTPGDNLPRDAAEVLIVSGRDTVSLPYSYSGEIELPPVATSSPLGAADPRRSTDLNAGSAATAAPPAPDAAAPVPAPVPPLCLWLHTTGQSTPRRWLVHAGVEVGALPDCAVQVDWSRVSGQHLSLQPDEQGRWQVQDHSSNGTLCLDAEQPPSPGNPPERPLPKGQTLPLPRAGSLRLGASPQDPLLHFAQLAAPQSAAVAAEPPRPASSRRATDLGPAAHGRHGTPT